MSDTSSGLTQDRSLLFRCRPQYKISYVIDQDFEETSGASLMKPAGNVMPENYELGPCSVEEFTAFIRGLAE